MTTIIQPTLQPLDINDYTHGGIVTGVDTSSYKQNEMVISGYTQNVILESIRGFSFEETIDSLDRQAYDKMRGGMSYEEAHAWFHKASKKLRMKESIRKLKELQDGSDKC